MPDAVVGALVGGLIGLISGLSVAALSIVWAYRHDIYRRALTRHRVYLSWLSGLIPECEFIISTLNQLEPAFIDMLNTGNLRCPTKRLNDYFLSAALVGIIKHPRGATLFPKLTAAHRDVVHTNDMMARYETRYIETAGSATQWPEIQGILVPTSQCIPGVRASVSACLSAAREQQQLEVDNSPTLWQPE
jgi:hypothetical protein